MRWSTRPIHAFFWACPALLLLTSAGTAWEKDPLKLENVPKFDSTSNEPILLRYKLKPGQVEKIVVDMEMNMHIKQGAQEFTMKIAMRIEAKDAVSAVDAEGNMTGVVKITRMKMKVAGPKEVEFDSDKPTDDPNFKGVTAMIGVGIPCKISPVGKMLETDLDPIRQAARRANDAALAKSFEDSAKQMFDGTYIQLSEKPIKAGETYKAGTIVSDKVKIHNSYKVLSVSADKTKTLLEPVAVLEMAPGAFPPGVDVKMKTQRVAGWLLFDLQKGHLSKGEIRMLMTMDINAMGQTGTMEMSMKTTLTSTVE